MKILHINPGYPFTALYARMLEAFSEQHSHTVYVPLRVGRTLPGAYSDSDKRVIHSRDYWQFHRPFYHWKRRKVAASLLQQVRVHDFDLVHAHFLFSAGGVAYSLNKRFGTKYIVSVRNTDVNTFFKYGVHLRKVGLRIMENAERIIFINPSYRDFVLNRYVHKRIREQIKSRSHVIPNGIDPFWFDHMNTNAQKPSQGKVSLLFVGEFTKNKNVRSVVLAANLLRDRGHEVRLDLVGDGPEFSVIKQLVVGQPHIRLHGRISSKQELMQLYRKADVFVMPSFNETFGLVYIEAMSQGVPVIYTKGQGIDGYFPDGTVGYAVNPRIATVIADKVEDVLQDYEAMSARCIDAARRFSWTEISRELEILYEEALDNAFS